MSEDLVSWRVHFTQTVVREIVVNARDDEEAVGLANLDLYTDRDATRIVCTYLGTWRATRVKD